MSARLPRATTGRGSAASHPQCVKAWSWNPIILAMNVLDFDFAFHRKPPFYLPAGLGLGVLAGGPAPLPVAIQPPG